jgi:RAB protein geranylgeranyltransferase component A
MFRNKSGSEARLVIEMHPRADENGKLLGPERICTALVEDGGSQFLTLVFAQSSRTLDEGYAFTVPGSDAELEVVVP